MLRDDYDHIPFPGHWDFPGGEREPGETPEECILRETAEEVSLILKTTDISRVASYERPSGTCWFFVARLPTEFETHIALGTEGQCWKLMSVDQYANHPKRIPHFAHWLSDFLFGNNTFLGKTPREKSGGR